MLCIAFYNSYHASSSHLGIATPASKGQKRCIDQTQTKQLEAETCGYSLHVLPSPAGYTAHSHALVGAFCVEYVALSQPCAELRRR